MRIHHFLLLFQMLIFLSCRPGYESIEISISDKNGDDLKSFGIAFDSALSIYNKNPYDQVTFILDGDYVLDSTLHLDGFPLFHLPITKTFKSIDSKSATIRGNDTFFVPKCDSVKFIEFQMFDTLLLDQTIRITKKDYDFLKGENQPILSFYTQWKYFKSKIDSVYAETFFYSLDKNIPLLRLVSDTSNLISSNNIEFISVERYFLRLSNKEIGRVQTDYAYTLCDAMDNSSAPGQLLTIKGSLDHPMNNVRFENIRFTNNGGSIDKDDYTGQSAFLIDGAIAISNAQHITFNKCEFDSLANFGLAIGKGSKNIIIEHSRFSDLGAGAIKIGEFVGGKRIEDEYLVSDVQFISNEISNCGLIWPNAAGILVGQSSNNTIANNHIHGLAYTGISVGWTWQYKYVSKSQNNTISNNLIHDIGGPLLDDLGGIYTLGDSKGTVIQQNEIYNVRSRGGKARGIYLDQSTSNIKVINNVIRHNTEGIFLHWGKNNLIDDNIIMLNDSIQLATGALEQHLMLKVNNNVIVAKNNNFFSNGWQYVYHEMDNNTYWDIVNADKIVFPGGMSFQEWQAFGRDENSQIRNPFNPDGCTDVKCLKQNL